MSIGEDRIAARNVERAMMIMVAAMLLLPAIDALAKVLAATVPAGLIAWSRFAFQTSLLAPAAMQKRRTAQRGLQGKGDLYANTRMQHSHAAASTHARPPKPRKAARCAHPHKYATTHFRPRRRARVRTCSQQHHPTRTARQESLTRTHGAQGGAGKRAHIGGRATAATCSP